MAEMQDRLLSIITVTKNCAVTLERTLRSVREVKTQDIEYIVVDGASTDGTLDLVHRYGDLVDTVISEPDTGIYNAMNKGVALAKSEYVLFINGDDELVADGFPTVMRALREKRAPVVCATTLVGAVDVPIEVLKATPRHLLFFNSIPHPSAFTATRLLRAHPFREDLCIASDYDFFLQAYLAGHRFGNVDAVTALHQRGGASGNSARSQAEVKQIRQQRLGWRYPVLNGLMKIYRGLKGGRKA